MGDAGGADVEGEELEDELGDNDGLLLSSELVVGEAVAIKSTHTSSSS